MRGGIFIEVAVHKAVGMRANPCQNACPHVSLHLFMFDDGARRWRANGAADCGADFGADCGTNICANFSAIHAANFNANIYANICANICAIFNKRHWVKRVVTRNATHRSIASARGKYKTQIKDHVFQQCGLIHVRSATSGRARAAQSARAD